MGQDAPDSFLDTTQYATSALNAPVSVACADSTKESLSATQKCDLPDLPPTTEDSTLRTSQGGGLYRVLLQSVKQVATVRHGIAAWQFRAQGRIWCLRLGMKTSSWDGWAKMHVNPFFAMGYYFSSASGYAAASAYIITVLQIEHLVHCYVVTIPWICRLSSFLAFDFSMWRWGPQAVVHETLYQAFNLFVMSCAIPVLYVGFMGPPDTVPWNDRLLFVGAICVEAFFAIQASSAGRIRGEVPLEPRGSIVEPVCRSFIYALLVIDGLTDLSLVRSLLDAKYEDCMWFGQRDRCHIWTWFIAVYCAFGATDLATVLFMIVLGTEKSSKGKRMHRLYTILEVSCVLCELGVVVCTILYLFSTQKNADQPRKLLAFLSLASTLATLVVMFIGTSKMSRAALMVWRKVTGRGAHFVIAAQYPESCNEASSATQTSGTVVAPSQELKDKTSVLHICPEERQAWFDDGRIESGLVHVSEDVVPQVS